MAPKRSNAAVAPATPSLPLPPAAAAAAITAPAAVRSTAGRRRWDEVLKDIGEHYRTTTPAQTRLIDAFLAFLVAVGAVQFVHCVLAGNYPFNAFLSGFAAAVGQFVLTASLRIQTTKANAVEFAAVSHERAFADYIVCSVILHFFCVNFIN